MITRICKVKMSLSKKALNFFKKQNFPCKICENFVKNLKCINWTSTENYQVLPTIYVLYDAFGFEIPFGF